MADVQRIRRIGELIQRELAGLLQREVKDPRVKNLIISAVEVNRDLSVAKVFYTCLDSGMTEDSAELIKRAQQGLEKAGGFIRHLLGQRIQIRSVPKLYFIYDQSTERGNYMSHLIDEIIEKDEQKQYQD